MQLSRWSEAEVVGSLKAERRGHLKSRVRQPTAYESG